MPLVVGIRREDKNKWEGRIPLTPADIADLSQRHGLQFIVQPSTIRAFADDEFREAGIRVEEDLGPAGLVLAVKEIPTELLRPDKRYLYFAHVIKGQPYNMPMLRRLLELNCTMLDYERIVDEQGRRLIFFGVQAGHAGMIETLWCLGRRLESRGIQTPLTAVRHAYEYDDLAAAKSHIREIGERIDRGALDDALRPLVFGVAGYGNVSRGAQEILDCFPIREVAVEELPTAARRGASGGDPLVKVVFKEEHLVRPVEPGAPFELQDYYDHPERYQGCFDRHLPHLDVLVNTIYWTERYPRLVTREWARQNFDGERSARLQVIGDISCDIEGSIEFTLKVTEPDAPCFVYDPRSNTVAMGCDGPGPAVMAVDNLPSEMPREASQHFSNGLREIVPTLAETDWSVGFEALDLPHHLKTAVITHHGRLTPEYAYLKEHLKD